MRYFDKLNSEISSSTFLLRTKFYFIFLTISKPTPIKINNLFSLSLFLLPLSFSLPLDIIHGQ